MCPLPYCNYLKEHICCTPIMKKMQDIFLFISFHSINPGGHHLPKRHHPDSHSSVRFMTAYLSDHVRRASTLSHHSPLLCQATNPAPFHPPSRGSNANIPLQYLGNSPHSAAKQSALSCWFRNYRHKSFSHNSKTPSQNTSFRLPV